MRLHGKVAVITGAGSGIGRATAELMAAQGAKVLGGDLNTEALDAVAATVKQAGGEMSGLKTNIAVKADTEALITEAVNRYGKIDILVNNAGIMDYSHGIATVPDDVWERVFAVNVTGMMYATRKAVSLMLDAGGGTVINIASTAALNGASAGAAYTASKHAVLGLTRSTAWQYAQHGIRCNAVCPGGTATNIAVDRERWDKDGAERNRGYYSLMPMVMDAADIANAVLYLASDEAKKINGAIIAADGGWSVS